MEILILIILGLWMNSGWQKTKNRMAVLEEEVSNLRTALNILEKDNSSVIKSPINIVRDPIGKPYIPIEQIQETAIEQPVSQPLPTAIETDIYDTIYAIKEDSAKTEEIEESESLFYQYTENSEPLLPDWIMRSLTGGRLFVTLGMLLLFIGVAMLFKYADVSVPIKIRFIAVAIGALGMISFGHKQINTRRDYGLYLLGGGLGILFLTTFVAFKSYALLEPSTAFMLLSVIGVGTFASAVKYNTMALAVLAITGGFTAPILTSTGHGSHIGLFSYYLLLNLIIFAIAWSKSWRVLNSIGFAFTFIIGLMWGERYYVPEFYSSVQAFLIAYFLLYVGIGILFASRNRPNISVPIDAASIFGVPLIGFSLQLALTKHFPDGDMFSCLALGTFYGILSIVLRNNERAGWKLLSEIFTWLSVLFFTLAIPFTFDTHTTAPLWAMEGVAMLWMMGRSKQGLYGYAGILLIFLSNLFLLANLNLQGNGTPFANSFFISSIILAIAHFLAAYLLHPERSSLKETETISGFLSRAGMLWWFIVGGAELRFWYQLIEIFPTALISCLAFYSLSALAAFLIHKRFSVILFEKPIELMLPVIIGFSIIRMLFTHYNNHPLMYYGYIDYFIAFAVYYYWLWIIREHAQPWHYVLAYITLVILCGFELGYYTNMLEVTIAGKTTGWLLAALAGVALLELPRKYLKWPITIVADQYHTITLNILLSWATILCLFSFTSISLISGQYVSLFNLIDISELLTIIVFIAFYRKDNTPKSAKNAIAAVVATLVFLFINALMLRFISYNIGVEYFSHKMFNSVIIQTSLSILWTLISMAAMLISSKHSYRDGWFAGAILLGIVVLKLFLTDLASVETISRIISFMGVGLLTIFLGYFSPIPPKKEVNNGW